MRDTMFRTLRQTTTDHVENWTHQQTRLLNNILGFSLCGSKPVERTNRNVILCRRILLFIEQFTHCDVQTNVTRLFTNATFELVIRFLNFV